MARKNGIVRLGILTRIMVISLPGVNPCEVGQTPCNSVQCIPSEDVCNGQDDCGDGSDEEGCRMFLQTLQFHRSSPQLFPDSKCWDLLNLSS